MSFPQVIPHSDGAGRIDAVGAGVDPSRVGQRVWVYGAQSYRAYGTAAQAVAVPEHLAIDLPDQVRSELGACLGIPGITAHRAVFSDGPVAGKVVLVHGVLGAVGSLAAWKGLVALDDEPVRAVRRLAPNGGARIHRGCPFGECRAFHPEAKAEAVRDLTSAAADGSLKVPIGATYPLEEIAAAHRAVEGGGTGGRVLIALD